jgi:hypothetical protein
VIAKIKQPGESLERSSSSLVEVVCLQAARLPIQLWYSFATNLAYFVASLTTRSNPSYPESMPTLHTFCCCRRSPLAYTEARCNR